MPDEHEHSTPAEQKIEVTDAHVGPIVAIGVVLVVGTAIAFVIGYILLKSSTARPAMTDYEPSPLVTERQEWEAERGVRLQVDLDADYKEYEAQAKPALHAHGILSEEPEIYHFPIEDAIDHVADHGLPEFEPFGDGSLEPSGD